MVRYIFPKRKPITREGGVGGGLKKINIFSRSRIEKEETEEERERPMRLRER